MSLPPALAERIAAVVGAKVREASSLHGGDIAAVWRVELADGRNVVVKSGARLDLEAWMLHYLAEHSIAPVPAVYHAKPDLLVMDHIAAEGGLSDDAQAHLGEIVAALHAVKGPRFGFERDTLIGSLVQPNPQSDDWRAFFRDARLRHMGRAALDAGRLPAKAMARIEQLCGKLDRWIHNDAPPSLIHGDLWGGNILAKGSRVTGLIDPAIYYADPEIELAFMTLFGSVGDRFFARYAECGALRPGFFEERRDLYNLYPLLVHVRLFGGQYAQQVERVLSRYGC